MTPLEKAQELVTRAYNDDSSIQASSLLDLLKECEGSTRFCTQLGHRLGCTKSRVLEEIKKLAHRVQVRKTPQGRHVTDLESVRTRRHR